MRRCFECQHDNEDSAGYCVKCGTTLDPQAYSRLLARTERKQTSAPRAYPTLRLLSGLFGFMGWIIIVLGWMLAITAGAMINEALYTTLNISSPNTSLIFSALSGVAFTMLGLSCIATGELIKLFLDIGGDIRAIREK